jgi:hypothetical protein
MLFLTFTTLLALGPALGFAQYPATPSGLTVVKSLLDDAVQISYKEVQPLALKIYRVLTMRLDADMQTAHWLENLQWLRSPTWQRSGRRRWI